MVKMLKIRRPSMIKVKVLSPDGTVSRKNVYSSREIENVLAEVAVNLTQWFPHHRYESVAVVGGYNFVSRGRKA